MKPNDWKGETERLRPYEQAHICSEYSAIPIEYLAALGDAIYAATYGIKRGDNAVPTDGVPRRGQGHKRMGNINSLETSPLEAARATSFRAAPFGGRVFESAPPTGDPVMQRIVDVELRGLRKRAERVLERVEKARAGENPFPKKEQDAA